MQQRQLRLGDILDDYCPRERRVTNHAVVAMVGDDVKQTRCTTCDTEHEFKHAKVPRQRRKSEAPAALYAAVAAGGPKVVVHEHEHESADSEAVEDIAASNGNGADAPHQPDAPATSPTLQADAASVAHSLDRADHANGPDEDAVDDTDD